MIIGKQSNLNDLQALKAYLEEQIAVAAAIKADSVTQIESGNLSTGSVYDERPTGVYHVDTTVQRPIYTDGNNTGMLLHMDFNRAGDSNSDGYSTGLFVDWEQNLSICARVYSEEKSPVRVLSSKNTITDANGFIKAA